MLKYKLKENSISPFSTNPIEDYLKSLGIKKPESFLTIPPKEDELNPATLNNINQCAKMLHDGFTQNKRFLLIVDCDVDGFTSSAIFYRYFKNLYPEAQIKWVLHEEKEHGIEKDKIDLYTAEDIDYVIIPDAGSAQLEEQQQLLAQGKTIIIIDHHHIDTLIESPQLVVVNNQLGDFANKSLSGAGVVLKVIQYYNQQYGTNISEGNNYYDLAALGIISDMMSLRDLDNNYIVYRGLHTIHNKMFKALLDKQSYSIAKDIPTKIDVAFYIAPLINGVIRMGTMEEKEMLFRGFIELPTENIIETTFAGQTRKETFYDYVARTAYNTKNRQNTQKERCMEFLKKRIEEKGLNKNKVVVVITSKDDKVPTPQNITGLVAMELLKEYGKPTLVLRPKMEEEQLVYSGSARGKQADGFESFLEFMRGSKYCLYAEGHDMAFGASIAATCLVDFINESNERLKNIDFDTEFIEVDAIFDTIKHEQINREMILEFAEYEYVFGNAIPQPKIAIEGYIDTNYKLMGEQNTSVRISLGGVDCIKFKDKVLCDQVASPGRKKVTIIGRANRNEWNGFVTPQIMIDNIEVGEPINTRSLF